MWRAVRPSCRTAPLCPLFRSGRAGGAAQQQGARWVPLTAPCCCPARLCTSGPGLLCPLLDSSGYCVPVPSVTACPFSFPPSSPVLWDESGNKGSLVAVRRGSCCCVLYQQATFKCLCNVSVSPRCCQSSRPTFLPGC